MSPTATAQSQTATRFRQRKISLKQNLRVFYQKDISEADDDLSREVIVLETGVEKGEEEEHHLQAVLNASNAALTDQKAKVANVYIPTPDASKVWAEYKKYYKPDWIESESYIRQSATVEDTSGCPYNMDEEDDEFLKTLNKDITEPKSRCSEDEFEMISHLFESTIQRQQPFLSTDINQLLGYKELETAALEYVAEHDKDPASIEKLLAKTKSVYTPEYAPSPYRTVQASFKTFGARIYDHWRVRKVARMGKPVFPALKFENDAVKDENDPYVCFRHREVRHARKTRRTDQQSNERLRRLQMEMEQAKKLFKMVARREAIRMDVIQADWDVFEQQCKVKTLKRKLGISSEDEDLLTIFKKRKEERKLPNAKRIEEDKKEKIKQAAPSTTAPPAAAAATAPAATAREPTDPSHPLKVTASRIPDLDLVTLEQTQQDKETAMRTAIKAKLRARSQNDRGWVNYSDNPFVPYYDFFDPDEVQFRSDSDRILDDSQALYSSIASSFPTPTDKRLTLPLAASLGKSYAARNDVEPQVIWTELEDDGDMIALRRLADKDITSGSHVSVPRFTSVSFHKRIDRRGLTFIDRRGLIRKPESLRVPQTEEDERLVDRFKFDSENTTEYMGDSFGDPARLNGISEDTQSIRFGSMLLSKSYETFQEAQLLRQQQVVSKHQKYAQQRKEMANAAAAAIETAQAQNKRIPGQTPNGVTIPPKVEATV